MAQYFEKLLNSINQAGYRLPEAGVFAALEEFKLQCNQVLAYKHMSLHFRHFIKDEANPNDDGGYIALHGLITPTIRSQSHCILMITIFCVIPLMMWKLR